ncbi:cytochrome c oxidase assembly factor 5-like [Daphnia pulex]|uniref:Cytochrome c oxidase assembly factor 5 n=1 Tax=Daphnia pulex TaxID=6669 RepID=E9G1T2_DAPPU|nr:cytochrome c oxidase assembly factor 5-like [Daphnia pulex]XP_046639302.1 cytochrome c oxidase assembly factor 5-like [Daphnia pulicaria]EFX86759.1 hypothetical protein DAPPUDRAFT_230465 [Daphnia pulex]|eukprot:EFX86759.1 hypothetical protein DAPPUDRAFT_230465 [Daphnia pulex]
MPQSFYEPEQLVVDTRPCSALREDLKFCIQNTDCFKKEKKTPRQCLLENHPSVPAECHQLRQSFFECKRSILDNRQRFRGRKEYSASTPKS